MRRMKKMCLSDFQWSALWPNDLNGIGSIMPVVSIRMNEADRSRPGLFTSWRHIHLHGDSLPDALGNDAEILEDISADFEFLQIPYHWLKLYIYPGDPQTPLLVSFDRGSDQRGHSFDFDPRPTETEA